MVKLNLGCSQHLPAIEKTLILINKHMHVLKSSLGNTLSLWYTGVPRFRFDVDENERNEREGSITFRPIFDNFGSTPNISDEVLFYVTINDAESTAIRQGPGELACFSELACELACFIKRVANE